MKTKEIVLYDSYYSREKEDEVRRAYSKTTQTKKIGFHRRIFPITEYSKKLNYLTICVGTN